MSSHCSPTSVCWRSDSWGGGEVSGDEESSVNTGPGTQGLSHRVWPPVLLESPSLGCSVLWEALGGDNEHSQGPCPQAVFLSEPGPASSRCLTLGAHQPSSNVPHSLLIRCPTNVLPFSSTGLPSPLSCPLPSLLPAGQLFQPQSPWPASLVS